LRHDASHVPAGTRVALVHHWLVTYRGGERVLAEIAGLFPEAPIFTLFFDPAAMPPALAQRDVRPSWLAPLRRHHQASLPLHPLGIASLDLRDYDLVLSSDAGCMKAVRTAPGAVHLCYCYTPMRWAWDERRLYVEAGVPRPLRPLAYAGLAALRAYDRAGARRVDAFATCSAAAAARLRRCYGRDASVVHPPVDLDTFTPDPRLAREDFYLCVGELVPYKRLERAIEAFSGSGRRLLVVGDGPLRASLRARAGAGVELLGSLRTDELVSHYRRCRALIVPAEEDFGIATLEAQACGAPAIAFAEGGSRETLVGVGLDADSEPCDAWPLAPTGVLFTRGDARGLADAVGFFERERERFTAEACVAHARRFSAQAFRAGFTRFVEASLARRAPAARAPGRGSAAPRGSRSA
jgi:glycosyltransferase involved in cell wall biosynthesis